MKITILYSGGIDSLGLLTYARHSLQQKPRCLFFDIGQPYLDKEVQALSPEVERRRVDWLRGEEGSSKGSPSGDIYIPGRNLVLLSLAASITLPDEIWLGALAGETHARASDKNFEFLQKAQDVMRYALRDFCPGVTVRFPFAELGWNKLQVVRYMLDAGVLPERITSTSSCLSGGTGKCGRCVVCLRRWGIFTQLGLSEDYECDPPTSAENYAIIVEMLRAGSYYDEFRREEVLPAVEAARPKLYSVASADAAALPVAPGQV